MIKILHRKATRLILLLMMAAIVIPVIPAAAAGGVSLYTKFSGVAVTPGELMNYSISIINNSDDIQRVSLKMIEQPEGWEISLIGVAWNVNQISVRPHDEETITLQTEVPLKVEKGNYRFVLQSTDSYGTVTTLPINIEVSEQGTFKTELNTDQPNMQGNADSNFNYRLNLKNRTADEQLYGLSASLPRGWGVDFKVSDQKVTSVKVEANTTQEVNVTIDPPDDIEAGTYEVPVKAQAGSTSAEVTLEVNITGTYKMDLSTPTGRLSTDLTAGKEKMVELQITNTGSTELREITLSKTAPMDWQVRFKPTEIVTLPPGEKTTVQAYIKASSKAIAGDYVLNIHAATPEVSSNADFRITVKTSLLWGWIGVLIIFLVAYGVYYLFRRYGRQ